MGYTYPAEVWECDHCGNQAVRECVLGVDNSRLPEAPEGWWFVRNPEPGTRPSSYCNDACLFRGVKRLIGAKADA